MGRVKIWGKEVPGFCCLFLAVYLFCPASDLPGASASAIQPKDTVILVHGILNGPIFMKRIERTLKKSNYEVINWSYSSRMHHVEKFAKDLNDLVESVDTPGTIHFVGFSLGAIVIRYYMTHYKPNNIGRFVMIAPPNHGSEKAEILHKHLWFRLLFGYTAIKQIFASNKAFFDSCGIPSCDFGIIAGGRGDRKGRSKLLPGDDDGAVSVSSTKLEGANDFIRLDRRHTGLLLSKKTSANVRQFLRTGHFLH